MKRLIIISLTGILTMLMMSSCTKNESDSIDNRNREAFMSKSDVGIYNIDAATFTMNKTSQVIYINKTQKIFRVMNPEATSYAQFKLSTAPIINTTLTVGINGVNINGVPTIELPDGEVVKNDGNKYWIWSHDQTMGLIMIWM